MRIQVIEGQGYIMRLSANDTEAWANRPGARWPCSTLSGRRCRVEVDSNGLLDLDVSGIDSSEIDATELDAMVSDFLPTECRNLWPVWGPK